MNISKHIIATALVALALPCHVGAAPKKGYELESHYYNIFATPSRVIDERQWSEQLVEQRNHDLKFANSRMKPLPLSRLKSFDGQYWTDGFSVCLLRDIDDNGTYVMSMIGSVSRPVRDNLLFKLRKRGKGLVVTDNAHCGVSASFEDFGETVVLVVRDAAGAPVDAFTEIIGPVEEAAPSFFGLHAVLDGVWRVDGLKDLALIGPFTDLLKGEGNVESYSDPGLCLFGLDENNEGFYLSYGDRRVSHGDPSYRGRKMPGAGGAGSIQGPMIWFIQPGHESYHVEVVKDAPFVSKHPEFPAKFRMQKVAGQYGSRLPGIWPCVSVMPISRALLSMLPKNAAKQMFDELAAKKHLSDIERLNKSILGAALKKGAPGKPNRTKATPKTNKRARRR